MELLCGDVRPAILLSLSLSEQKNQLLHLYVDAQSLPMHSIDALRSTATVTRLSDSLGLAEHSEQTCATSLIDLHH